MKKWTSEYVGYTCMSMGVKAHQAKVIYINNVRQNKTKSIQSDECTVTGLESCIIFPFRRSILLIVLRGYDTNISVLLSVSRQFSYKGR